MSDKLKFLSDKKFWLGVFGILYFALLFFFSHAAQSAEKDYAHESIETLIDDLRDVDQIASGLTFMTTYEKFVVEESPPKPGWGTDIPKQDRLIPQMSEIVRRGVAVLPALIAHLNDKRPTKLTVGPEAGKSSPLWWGEFHEEYDPRVRPEVQKSPWDTPLSGKGMDHRYTFKIGDICFALIGQIVNRNLWPYRYQMTGGDIVNSPIESPTLAQKVIKDWGGLTAAQHRESLIKDIHDGLNGYQFAPAMARLKFYYPDAYNALSGHDLDKRKLFEEGSNGYASHEDHAKDYAKDIPKYRAEAEKGDGTGNYMLAQAYANGWGVPQDYAQAIKLYKTASDHGMWGAQNTLGDYYAQGKGTKQDYVEAARWYKMAADHGSPYSQLALGRLYYRGLGVKQDHTEALKWYQKVSDRGGPKDKMELGAMYFLGDAAPQNYSEALKLWRQAADQGHIGAMYAIAWMYENGRGVKQDYVEAVKWYQRAADGGFSVAQLYLARMYIFGRGVPKNDEKAFELTKKVADKGDAKANLWLGDFYEDGKGVKRDIAEAYRRYNIAADQGAVEAQESLGSSYFVGGYIPPNYQSAYYWLSLGALSVAKHLTSEEISAGNKRAENWKPVKTSKDDVSGPLKNAKDAIDRGEYSQALQIIQPLAKQGNAEAESMLGNMYIYGQGLEVDYSAALEWNRKSAAQGNASAEEHLGVLYFKGRGVDENIAKAHEWFQKAADQGDPDGQHWIGDLYSGGHDVMPDDAEAAKWYRKAADQGQIEAQRDLASSFIAESRFPQDYKEAYFWYKVAALAAARKLTPEQIKATDKKISEWKPTPATSIH